MPNHFPRVSLPYCDISGVIKEWSETVETMVVFQHDADGTVERTHCHILMLNAKYHSDTYKRMFHSRVETDLEANALWRWKDRKNPDRVPDIKAVIYMSKGQLRPLFQKNITDQEIGELRSQWVQPAPKGKSPTQDTKSKTPRISVQQAVITESILRWEKHKRAVAPIRPARSTVVDIVCQTYRDLNRGLNPFQIRDICYAVLYDDKDYQVEMIQKIKSHIDI